MSKRCKENFTVLVDKHGCGVGWERPEYLDMDTAIESENTVLAVYFSCKREHALLTTSFGCLQASLEEVSRVAQDPCHDASESP